MTISQAIAIIILRIFIEGVLKAFNKLGRRIECDQTSQKMPVPGYDLDEVLLLDREKGAV